MKQIIIVTQNGAIVKIPLSLMVKLLSGEEDNVEIEDENGWKWNIRLGDDIEDRKNAIIKSNKCPVCGSELEKSPLYDTTYEEFNEIVGTEWYCPVCKKVVISGETLMPEFGGE